MASITRTFDCTPCQTSYNLLHCHKRQIDIGESTTTTTNFTNSMSPFQFKLQYCTVHLWWWQVEATKSLDRRHLYNIDYCPHVRNLLPFELLCTHLTLTGEEKIKERKVSIHCSLPRPVASNIINQKQTFFTSNLFINEILEQVKSWQKFHQERISFSQLLG